MHFVQRSCILPRWMVHQQVAAMSKRPPPNIHRYVTKKRRFLADLNRRMDWTEPLLKSEEERKQKALENEGKEIEPHMLHVVYLLKRLSGRPWWEKKIAEKLQLEEVWCILSLWNWKLKEAPRVQRCVVMHYSLMCYCMCITFCTCSQSHDELCL